MPGGASARLSGESCSVGGGGAGGAGGWGSGGCAAAISGTGGGSGISGTDGFGTLGCGGLGGCGTFGAFGTLGSVPGADGENAIAWTTNDGLFRNITGYVAVWSPTESIAIANVSGYLPFPAWTAPVVRSIVATFSGRQR
jgi:hypothetical protein